MIYANMEHFEELTQAQRDALAQKEVHWGPAEDESIPEGEEQVTLAELKAFAAA